MELLSVLALTNVSDLAVPCVCYQVDRYSSFLHEFDGSDPVLEDYREALSCTFC
jgi:hypothetical protein